MVYFKLTQNLKFVNYLSFLGLSQPGFMVNYNFLVPWDISVSKTGVTSLLDRKSSRKSTGENDNNKLKDSSAISIRGFIGMEYECPCGHRFICSGPDRLIRVSSNGTVKVELTYLLNNFEATFVY